MYNLKKKIKNHTSLYTIPESIWIEHIYTHMNIRDICKLWWVCRLHYQQENTSLHNTTYETSLKLISWLCNDRYYLRIPTAQTLHTFLKQSKKRFCVEDIRRIYSPLRTQIPISTYQPQRFLLTENVFTVHTITLDIGSNKCVALHRGICQCTPQHIHWIDYLTKRTHQRSFDWLVFPPWEIKQSCGTTWLPSEYNSVPPYITTIVGEPENTMCMTNYRQIYRMSFCDTQKENEIMLGGAFESAIQNIVFLHYCHPYLVVSGQPLFYDASSNYRCFGVWDIEKKCSVLSKIVQSIIKCSKHSLAQCYVPGVYDYLFYECAFVTHCGQWLYWKHRNCLYVLHYASGQVQCVAQCIPFQHHTVQRFVVCRIKSLLGIYCGKKQYWVLYDLKTYEHIHSFEGSCKTQFTILPFCSMFRFTRKYETKLTIQTISYDLRQTINKHTLT